MKKRFYICLLLALRVSGLMSGCGKDFGERTEINGNKEESWAEEGQGTRLSPCMHRWMA